MERKENLTPSVEITDIEGITAEFGLTPELLEQIKEQVTAYQAADPKKNKRVYPIIVEGDEFDDKELYIAYFRQPTIAEFSKFLTLSQNNGLNATRSLANDCFLGGDKELVTDDSLFQYGLTGQFSKIINTRRGGLVNLSKAGK